MSTIYSLNIKSAYNFSMKAGPILGYTFNAATVLGLLDFDSAAVIDDVAALHAAVYSSLGVGVPKNARDLIYVKIKTDTGAVRVLAMYWIASQPSLVSSQTVQVVISNVDLSQIETIRQILKTNGFPATEITVL